ncbi:hypothetical protein [Limnoglobus roseus]|uniref:Uncharacterized protein n=1 Tax=Limnoglobus roseus TaxID=2598579 RepID=A0A5C1A919_9BACT|nr:hypothetical protein [Limnoglobus roseus]QEL14703.1 hypothetical protein PX52LOC_01596 [Limnoglobus roseus]
MTSRLVLWVGVLLAVGCTKPSPNPPLPEKDKPRKTDDAPSFAPAAVTIPGTAGVDAATFANTFLKSVHEGTATAAQLTPQFKKVIAEPVFEADHALGYSDAAADNWLKQYQGKLTAPSVYDFGSDANAHLFTGFLPGEKPRFLTLRLAKAENSWRVDWFFPAEVGSAAIPKSGDAPTFAATAFLESLLGHNSPLAAGVMAPDAKKRLAPAFSSEKRPFNAGILDTKLTVYRGNFTGFTLAKVENGTATGELTGPGTKKPFTLKLVPGERSFDSLVDDVKVD